MVAKIRVQCALFIQRIFLVMRPRFQPAGNTLPEVDARGVHHEGAVQPRTARTVRHVHEPLALLHGQGDAQLARAGAYARQLPHLGGW